MLIEAEKLDEIAQSTFEAYWRHMERHHPDKIEGAPIDQQKWENCPEDVRQIWRMMAAAALEAYTSFDEEEGGLSATLRRIESNTEQILEETKKIMDGQDVLDSSLTTVETDLAALGTELTTAIADLEAKAAGTPIDFTPEVTRLQAVAATLTSLTASATSADPGAGSTPAAGDSSTGTATS